MKPLGFPLLADENIHPEVTQALAAQGKQVRTVQAEGLTGHDDAEILRHAHKRGWVVLTHDADFGTLSIRLKEPYTGIIYLRPGHINPAVVLEVLEAVDSLPMSLEPPFLVVAERRKATIRLRTRSGATTE